MFREIALGFQLNTETTYLSICHMYYREESFNNRQNIPPIVQYILPKRLQPLAEDREKGKSYVEVRGYFFSKSGPALVSSDMVG
jgi:hypothetical protein